MAGTRSIDYLYRIVDRFSPTLERMKRSAASFDARMSAGFKNLGAATEKYQKKLSQLGSRIQHGLGTAIKVGFVGAIATGTIAIRSFIRQASFIEDAVSGFTPLMGGAEKANQLVDELNKTASTTPFQFANISAAAKQLLPVMNQDIEKTVDTFRMLGDTAGGNAQKLDSITRGYTKAMLKGKVDMESLNMIAEAGVPIYSELASSMGVSVSEMMKMSSAGAISSGDLTAAFQKMTGEGGIFFKGMEIASMTFSGKMSTLKDNIALTSAALGAQLLPILKPLIDKMIIGAQNMKAFAEANGDLIKSKINEYLTTAKKVFTGVTKAVIGAYTVVSTIVKVLKILSPIIIPLVAAFAAYQATMYTAAAAMLVYNAVQVVQNALLTANPVGLVIAGFAALIAIVVIVIKYWDQITAAIKRAWTWFVNFYDTIKGVVAIYGGPMVYAIAAVIDMIRSLINNFDEIKAAFTDGGFVAGIKAIGSALLEGLIAPALSFLNVLKSIADKIANWGVFQAFVEIAKTIPGLILQYWQPIMDFFTMLIDKIGAGVGKVRDFFGGVGEKLGGFFGIGGEVPTAPMPSASAPIPMGYAANANAEASVSVYTEEGMSARPFNPRGNLGYNMSSRSRR